MATESNYDYKGLAKQRMLWAIKPILGICILVWVLHPSTAINKDMNKMKLKGFLVGAFYGIVVYRESFKKFRKTRATNGSEVKNRIPDEYYIGHIEKVLRARDEKEV
ncbi:MAG: hypothetical protein GY793_04630 [Proteobacteria bacterium]|nr:hypothetical protein [Pseudomonadota bacterium]